MARSRAATRPRSPRAAIQAIAVNMSAAECDDFDRWLRAATAAAGDREPFIKFAAWYPDVAQRWFDAATAVGEWETGRDVGRSARDYCRLRAESMAHAERADGVMVHFVVDTEERPYAFRARWCRDALPVPFTQRWTDDQQLTWEEFTSGEPCRVCGRGFIGAPEWKPVMLRTPEEAVAIEAEEAAFRALHPNCPTFSWRYGSTGITHCAECCPRPPLSPHQIEVLTRIAVDTVQRQHHDAIDLERRWHAAAGAIER